MGLMRFLLPTDRITEEIAQQAYLTGFDRVPWQVNIRYSPGELILERAASDSGAMHLTWPVERYGMITLSTGSLVERPEPYYLPLELARGKLGQLRNQMNDWRSLGLSVPADLQQKMADATRLLGQAAVMDQSSAESWALADQTIVLALDAAHQLAGCYTEQALAIRRRNVQRLPSLLGADLGISLLDDYTAREFLQTFNAADVPLTWKEVETAEETYSWEITDRQIEWCRARGLKVVAGPLLQLDARTIPNWLYLYEDDFEAVLTFASDFVRAAVNRYRGQVDGWICAGRLNTAEILGLAEEETVRLAARAVELTRQWDPQAAILVSFDQPWAEYMGHKRADFPPLHFADALVRANLGLTALMIEINVGYSPGGSMFRDPLEFSRHLDSWSMVGMPLYLSLCAPSAGHADPLAVRRAKLPPDLWNPRAQQAWVQRYVPLALAKPFVHGVIWNQLRDAEPHDFPHGGLFDLRRHPKPALRQLASVRSAYLR
jgi:hypothetical protein